MPKKPKKFDPATEKFIKESVDRKRTADKGKKKASEAARVRESWNKLRDEKMRDPDYRETYRRGSDHVAARKEVNDKMRALKNSKAYNSKNISKLRSERTKALSDAAKSWGVSSDEILFRAAGAGATVIDPAKDMEERVRRERAGDKPF